MRLTPEQSFTDQQATSILAQRWILAHPGKPCSSARSLSPWSVLTSALFFWISTPKGKPKHGKEESIFTHPQHCPEDELNYNITKKPPCEDSSYDFAMEELPNANPNVPDKRWKRETKLHKHFERVFWQKYKITSGCVLSTGRFL